MKAIIKAFVQARMSSQRYPGKVLAPFRGEAMIRHVLRAVEQALSSEDIVVVTSAEASDDPLVRYIESMDMQVHRGSLENVLARFMSGAREYPCDWIMRVNGDSPLLFPEVLRLVIPYVERDASDLVTTVFPRSFPKGQNVELIRVGALQEICIEDTTLTDQEHVTPFFYRQPDRFRIVNVESGDRRLAEVGLAVDTIEDFHRLERLSVEELRRFRPPVLATSVAPM
ncbi:MAG: Acylneuraminate cytidylyltransferase [Nitrospira sp.]|nr:NTP transferase domain-containing protein [Nitrospira sp.]ULA60202.1 MAG: Acylneuraminate cytidylyltransferase [Nitrospira sp.]